MPMVNGKKFPYNAAGMVAAKKASKNPDTVPADVDPETGIRQLRNLDKMSGRAMKGKDASMKARAKRLALQKFMKNGIPKSPTN